MNERHCVHRDHLLAHRLLLREWAMDVGPSSMVNGKRFAIDEDCDDLLRTAGEFVAATPQLRVFGFGALPPACILLMAPLRMLDCGRWNAPETAPTGPLLIVIFFSSCRGFIRAPEGIPLPHRLCRHFSCRALVAVRRDAGGSDSSEQRVVLVRSYVVLFSFAATRSKKKLGGFCFFAEHERAAASKQHDATLAGRAAAAPAAGGGRARACCWRRRGSSCCLLLLLLWALALSPRCLVGCRSPPAAPAC